MVRVQQLNSSPTHNSTPSPSRACHDGGSGATSDDSCPSRRKQENPPNGIFVARLPVPEELSSSMQSLPVNERDNLLCDTEVELDLSQTAYNDVIMLDAAHGEVFSPESLGFHRATTQGATLACLRQPQKQESVDSQNRSDLVTPYFKLRHSRTELHTNGSSLNGDHTDQVSTNKSKEPVYVYPYFSRHNPNADWTSMVDATKANITNDEKQAAQALTTIKEKQDSTIIADPVNIPTPMTERSLRYPYKGQLSPEEEKQNRLASVRKYNLAKGAQPLFIYSSTKNLDEFEISIPSPTLTHEERPLDINQDEISLSRRLSPQTYHELRGRMVTQSALMDYPRMIMGASGLLSKGSPYSPSIKGSLVSQSFSNDCSRTADLHLVACTSRSLEKPSKRNISGLTPRDAADQAQSVNQKTRAQINGRRHRHGRRLFDNSSGINNKQKAMEILNLEKCLEPSLHSGSFDTSDHEEGKDYILDIPNTEQVPASLSKETQNPIMRLKKHHPHSSQSLINFSDHARNARHRRQSRHNRRFQNDSEVRSPCTSPDRREAATSQTGDNSLQLANVPLRKSTSLGKRAMIDLGRSPQVPFVQNLRTNFKRNSSQRLIKNRSISPPDQTECYGGVSEKAYSHRRRSFGKSDTKSNKRRRQQIQQANENVQSAQKVTQSQHSSSTPLNPSDIFKKYEEFPDQSLKLSVYKEVSVAIIQAISAAQEISDFPPVSPVSKIDFQFKKKGFSKLLIFDLDETLIHSMRDEDELEFPKLNDVYEDNDPDLWVEMESPSSDYGKFQQGIYLRPYMQECLRAANIDYEVAIFTAGYDWYANPIIDKIDPSGTLIQHRFFRQHAQTINHRGQESLYKDLDVFEGIDLTKTLIIDNQVFCFAKHLSNGVPIAGFYGDKKDCELVKVMKYVHQIAQEENLLVANELQFGLQAMLSTPISNFAMYYQIDEMSESDENDFEEDGDTLHSSARRKEVTIFKQRKFDEEGESIEIACDDDSQNETSIKFNRSLGHEDVEEMKQDLRAANERRRRTDGAQSTQLLRLFSVAPQVTSQSPQNHAARHDVAMVRHQSAQHQVAPATIMQTIEDQYTLISKNDEGNIGGTLSNVHKSPVNNRESRNISPGPTDNGSAIMEFGEAMRQDNEEESLRVPQIHVSSSTNDIGQGLEQQQQQQASLPPSPYILAENANNKIAQNEKQNRRFEAVSSYHKVSLTSEKARRRQNSMGQRSSLQTDLNTATNLNFSPLMAARMAGATRDKNPLMSSYQQPAQQRGGLFKGAFNNSNISGQEAINNYYQQTKQKQPLRVSRLYSIEQQKAKGSDSYRGLQQRAPSEGRETITFADIVEMEQKTLTSVKKVHKASVAQSATVKTVKNQHSEARTEVKNQKRAGTPSEAFQDSVIRNVNNTLKPPNWTKRKHQVMRKLNSQTSPPMASNIDYHLGHLADIYKEGGKKWREGAEPSLMQQLLMANPENASYLTPSSTSQVTPSLLSGNKHFARLSSCHSMDKYQQLKNSVNRQSCNNSVRKPLFQQKSASLAVYCGKNPQNGIQESPSSPSQRSNSSPNIFKMQPQKVVGSGLLPPRPSQPAQSNIKFRPMQSGGGQIAGQARVKHQHSSPEKELRHSLLEVFNEEAFEGGAEQEQLSGELNPRIQASQAQGCVHDSTLYLTEQSREGAERAQ